MKYLFTFLVILYFSVVAISAQSKTTASFELWDINSLTTIGGHTVTVNGNPVVVTDPQMGDAVKFDGNGDMLIVDAAPIGTAKEFTVEVIFKPDGNSLNITNQPRFLCFWDPADASSGPRLTIELRVNNSYKWYFDGFLKTDISNLTLIDTTKTHTTGKWEHAAVVYKNNTFTTFINGVQELTGTVTYSSKVLNAAGKVSIGARFNKINWYSGLIKTVKITQSALVPSEFITNTLPTQSHNIKKGADINVYPIPAKNTINIESFQNMGNHPVNVSLYSFTGEKVHSGYFLWAMNNTISFNVENIQTGLYVLYLQGKNINYKQKIGINQ